MKIVAIVGTPHGMDGSGGLLVSSMLQGARDGGAETEIFSLSDYSVEPCKGCETCCKKGVCPIRDDYEKVRDGALAADGLILASPVYMNHVSAQLKAFLDRSYSISHRQMLVGKYAAVVATSGGGDLAPLQNYLLEVLLMMGCWQVGAAGAVLMQLFDETERAKVLAAAAALGRRMAEAIDAKETFSEQETQREQAFQLMKMIVQIQKDQWPFEYDYWKTHWGLEKTGI